MAFLYNILYALELGSYLGGSYTVLNTCIYIGGQSSDLTASPVNKLYYLYHQNPIGNGALKRRYNFREPEHRATTPQSMYSGVGLLSKEGGSRRPQSRIGGSWSWAIYTITKALMHDHEGVKFGRRDKRLDIG